MAWSRLLGILVFGYARSTIGKHSVRSHVSRVYCQRDNPHCFLWLLHLQCRHYLDWPGMSDPRQSQATANQYVEMGALYHIPFPVIMRSMFGMIGSYPAICIRGMLSSLDQN